jgi:protein subunit release factor A
MNKNKSDYITEDGIKIETDRYWDEDDKRVEVVKLTQISTGLEVAVHSYRGQVHAYNKALKKLDAKYLKSLN